MVEGGFVVASGADRFQLKTNFLEAGQTERLLEPCYGK